MNSLLKSAFVFLFIINGIGVSGQTDDQQNVNSSIKVSDVNQIKLNLIDQNTQKVQGFINFKNKPKSIFDASYQRYLDTPTKQNRFNLNLVNIYPDNNLYKGGNNLNMIRNGQSPYYSNAINQPTFTQELMFGVAQKFLQNLFSR